MIVKSQSGLAASIVFISFLLVAVVYQIFFDSGAEIVIHVLLALGAALLARAAFDFNTPAWITRTASVSMAMMAVIFALQALSLSITNDSLKYLAFTLLGQGFEKLLGYVFQLWCFAVLLTDSRGKTRVFGIVVVGLAIGASIAEYAVAGLAARLTELYKLLFLLPFFWILLESSKHRSEGVR